MIEVVVTIGAVGVIPCSFRSLTGIGSGDRLGTGKVTGWRLAVGGWVGLRTVLRSSLSFVRRHCLGVSLRGDSRLLFLGSSQLNYHTLVAIR